MKHQHEQQKQPQKPFVGQTVHYLSYGTPGGEFPSVERAAIVTQVHNDTCLDLCVLNPTGQFFNTSVVFGDKPGQWKHIEQA